MDRSGSGRGHSSVPPPDGFGSGLIANSGYPISGGGRGQPYRLPSSRGWMACDVTRIISTGTSVA